MLVGGILAGSAADRLGRRNCLLISLAINCTFASISAAAPSVGWLIAARVCAGLGVGGSIPVVFTLGAELFATRIRGAMVSLIASFWMVGSVFAAIAAWVVLGDDFGGRRIFPGGTWRHYALVAALPAVTALSLTFIFVPESPRFLAKEGRYDEMRAVMQRMTNAPVHLPSGLVQHSSTRRPGPSFASAWQSWRRSLGGGLYQSASGIAPDQITETSSMINNPEDELSRGSESSGTKDQRDGGVMRILCPGNDARLQRATIVLVVVWFTLSYGTYGVATWNNQVFADIGLSNPYLCSVIYSLSDLPGNVASIFLVERVGRKPLLSASMVLAAVAASVFALGSGSGAGVVISGACLFNAFSTCGWNALGVVSTEAFPTAARVSGMGLVSAAGRLGSIGAQFANGSLEGNVFLLLAVTSGLTLVGGLASLLLPRETLGVSLDGTTPDRAVS
ncbi:unnamed protein product [Ectocarpus sp. 6 AP-2014]